MTVRRLRLVGRALAIGVLAAWWIWLIGFQRTFVEVDGQAYWGLDLPNLYRDVQLGDQGAFLYSPAVALLFLPFSLLPYDLFYALFAAVNLAALVYLVGWELAAIGLFVVPISNEIARANIHLLLAAAIVIGFRQPSAWAWVLLTKVTPGVGLVWFAVRREWRGLAIAVAASLAIAVATFAFVPDLWLRWFELLARNADATHSTMVTDVALAPRLAVGVALVAVAAWRGIPAMVPVASMIALPAIWVNSLAMLVAVIPLLRHSRRVVGPPKPTPE